MSLRVLLVLEDHTNDQFIAKPIVQELLKQLGRPNARIGALMNPRMRGIDQVLDRAIWEEKILLEYRHIDLFVIILDRDCNSRGIFILTVRLKPFSCCPRGG